MRSVIVAGLAALGIGVAPMAASADQTVVVPGTDFPSSSTYLTYFGCDDLYHADASGPSVRITRDDAAPMGRRATNLALPGTGTASGPVSLVGSVATATSRLWVDAAAASSGVAYVWYVSDELRSGEVWAGRADLTTTAAGWQPIDTKAATYTWTRYRASTGKVVKDMGRATISKFTAAHGDGPGYLLSGFGCDGRAFDVDALQVGVPGSVTTYDLEGWQVSTSITASADQVQPGEQVQIAGTSVSPSGRVLGAPLVLEARQQGATSWIPVGEPVQAGPDGTVVTTVAPDVTTDYRWVFAETGYADAHVSQEVRVVVETAESQEPTPSGTASPSQSPPPPPSNSPSPSRPPSPSTSPSPTNSTSPSSSPTQEPSGTPDAQQTTAGP